MNAQRPKLNAERMARLVEISRVLNATTNLDHLLSRIITEAADLTSAEAASILLLDPNTQQLHFKASSNEVPPELADMAVSLWGAVHAGWYPFTADLDLRIRQHTLLRYR